MVLYSMIDQQQAGTGAILRDEKVGNVYFATSKKEMGVFWNWIVGRAVNNSIIESDSLIMVQTIQDESYHGTHW